MRLLLLSLFLVIPCSTVVAQPAIPALAGPEADAFRFGFQGFQLMLQEKGLQTVNYEQFRENDPKETVIVRLGESRRENEESGALLRHYLESGCAVLIASDRGPQRRLERFGVKFERGPITTPTRASRLNGLEDCPLIEKNIVRFHDIFKGIDRLATNRPGYISATGELTALAYLPDDAKLNNRSIGRRPIIAWKSFPNGGRLLVAADHSLFINEMIFQDDALNVVFADNVASWLADNRGTPRRYAYFVVDGRVQPHFEVPIAPDIPDVLPDIPPEALIPFINSISAGLEDENMFNRIMAAMSENLDLAVIAVMGTVTLLAFGCMWLLADRNRPPAQRDLHDPSAMLERRQEEIARYGSLGATAQNLAKQFFASRPFPSRPPGGRLGVELADGSRQEQRQLEQTLDSLWLLAEGKTPPSVDTRRLRRIVADIQMLQMRIDQGDVSIKWNESAAPAAIAASLRRNAKGQTPPTAPNTHRVLQAMAQIRKRK